MSQNAALAAFVVFIGCLFVRDVKRRPSVSGASWLVLMWAVIFASRPVSDWFHAGAAATVDGYLEGSPADRAVFLVLILAGYAVLVMRRVSISAIIRQNPWLFAFYLYYLLSLGWSDYPFVAFKRLFKDFGSVVMVLVLLTERDPVESAKAVLLRCAYLLVPVSVLFIRYIPELGRAYIGYNRDALMYIGVATHKNTLGALLLVTVVVIVWDMVARRADPARVRVRWEWVDGFIILAMTAWLLSVANSATALMCSVLGVGIFLATGFGPVERRLRHVEVYAIAGAAAWLLLDSAFSVTEFVVVSLGRDMTFTGRADAWQLVTNLEGLNPVVGAGFKSFWAGDRMAQVWRQFPGIVQAHNGYVEAYLEGGFVGVTLLLGVLLSGFRRIKKALASADVFARVRFTFWVLALFYNFSEAAITQLSLLWLVTLLVVTEGPGQPAAAVDASVAAPAPSPGAIAHQWTPRPAMAQRRWAPTRVIRPPAPGLPGRLMNFRERLSR